MARGKPAYIYVLLHAVLTFWTRWAASYLQGQSKPQKFLPSRKPGGKVCHSPRTGGTMTLCHLPRNHVGFSSALPGPVCLWTPEWFGESAPGRLFPRGKQEQGYVKPGCLTTPSPIPTPMPTTQLTDPAFLASTFPLASPPPPRTVYILWARFVSSKNMLSFSFRDVPQPHTVLWQRGSLNK